MTRRRKTGLASRLEPARIQNYLKLLALVSEVHDQDVQLLVPDLQCLQLNLVVFYALRKGIPTVRMARLFYLLPFSENKYF